MPNRTLPTGTTSRGLRLLAHMAGAASTAGAALLLGLGVVPAAAQSFDCTKARTATETAICSSADLKRLDSALAAAYTAAIGAGGPTQAPQLRTTQREWVGSRDRTCTPLAGDAARFTDCLAEAYRTRIAALAPSPTLNPPPAASATTTLPAQAVAPAPTPPPAPPPARMAAPALANLTLPAAPAANLSRGTVPASGNAEAMVEVKSPGRFSIRATSRTGVALQLIDMIAGPGEIAGDAGTRDGRLDVLLDTGVYKLRSFGAPKVAGEAAGDATLTIQPFQAMGGAAAELLRGGESSSDLADLQQRSAWVIVDAAHPLMVDAAGRSLGDVRAWRNGTDLAALTPTASVTEPKPGHTLTRLRLAGPVEPGLYLVTAYGGASLPRADGDTAQPLHLRVGWPALLPGGLAEGTIGPSGVTRFMIPAPATYLRLDLPEPAPVRLSAGRGDALTSSTSIARNSREPNTALSVGTDGGRPMIVEVSGLEGQKFRLRALQPASDLTARTPGNYLVSVDVAGETADDAPATVMLAQFQNGAARVVASDAIRIGAASAWRKRFNLRGPTSLLVEVTTAGPVAATTEGVGAKVALEPLFGRTPPRADGQTQQRWSVEPGWYRLRVDPVAGAVGIVDLTFGQPGLTAQPAPATPPRTTIDFGLQSLERGAELRIFANSAPRLVTAPKARLLPADLRNGPLVLSQPARAAVAPAPAPTPTPAPAPQRPRAGTAPAPRPATTGALTIPVTYPAEGRLAVTDQSGRPVEAAIAVSGTDKGITSATVTIQPVETERSIVLAVMRPVSPAPMPAISREAVGDALAAGTPVFFDLAEGGRRSFRLEVPEGGLYRVETLGRLKTGLRLSTSFLPSLDAAEDNGPGHNALMQTYLRAGNYRVGVDVSDSAGRLGLVARPSALIEAGTLVPGGSVRAALASGNGAVIGLDVTKAGTYRLDLYGLDRTFTARLEDAEGWPLTVPGELAELEQRFEPGRYRLVVLPGETDARVVARLQSTDPAPAPEGHGPHAFVFGTEQALQWREPAGKDAERTPDRWTFDLHGPAKTAIEIGDGMVGELFEVSGERRQVGRLVHTRGFDGTLPAGRYVVEARALGRNDRLDYTISLNTTEIQPGEMRAVELPASIPFAIVRDRVVGIATFGRTELTAALRNADGKVVERLNGRAEDWNIALSRLLPAGGYTLDLAAAKAPGEEDEYSGESESNESESGRAAVEVRLDLPAEASPRDLGLTETASATGAQVHRFMLPAIESGALLAVTAQSTADLVLSLERQDEKGGWQAAAFDQGRTPVIAVPAEASGKWRASAWAIDGGAADIKIAARAITATPQALGEIALAPLTIDGIATALRTAAIGTQNQEVVVLPGPHANLWQGSKPGRPLAAIESDVLAPQSGTTWLLARGNGPERLKLEPAAAKDEFAISLSPGDVAQLPASPAATGKLRLWRAASTFGQPGIEAGNGMGVVSGAAIALAGDAPVRIWNAGTGEALRLRADSRRVSVRDAVDANARYAAVLPAATAQRLRLAAGSKQLRLDLAAGTLAFLSDANARRATVWADDKAASRQLSGSWTEVILVNLGTAPAPVALDATPAAEQPALTAGKAMKRFFGAAGSLSLPIQATAGDRLTVAGGSAVFVGVDGRILHGGTLDLTSPGELLIEHGPGLTAAWIANDGVTPWKIDAATPVTPPQTVALDGMAKAFALKPATPIVLHARTDAPVILELRSSAPELFPAGAEFHRYLAAGETELRLYSPHEGPLTGRLELTASPVIETKEGIGEPQALAPGASLLFAFEVTRAGQIGVGLRADPDLATARLLDAKGQQLGEGVAQLRKLEPGRYLLEARAPADGATLTVRPAVIGLTPPDSGPPPDVARRYLDLVGLSPVRAR